MKNTTRIVYAMHIVNENEGAKFPEIFIDLSEPTGFSNMTMREFWWAIENCYIDDKNSHDPDEREKYYNKITIEFWIAERIEGHGVNCLQRDCKLLHKIITFNVNECIVGTFSPFRLLMETMFKHYPESKGDTPPAKFNTVI